MDAKKTTTAMANLLVLWVFWATFLSLFLPEEFVFPHHTTFSAYLFFSHMKCLNPAVWRKEYLCYLSFTLDTAGVHLDLDT